MESGFAVGGGGIGVYEPYGNVVIDSCLVWTNRSVTTVGTDNKHAGYGGGIGVDFNRQGSSVTILNTTIVGNVAGEDGGLDGLSKGAGVCTINDSKSMLAMTNCIIACNATVGTNTTMALNYAGGVDYCFFDVADDVLGANSKTGDPLFRNVARGDYRLRAKSPCIDAGYKGEWMTDASLSLDGKPRIMGRGPDMGCYETNHSGFSISLR